MPFHLLVVELSQSNASVIRMQMPLYVPSQTIRMISQLTGKRHPTVPLRFHSTTETSTHVNRARNEHIGEAATTITYFYLTYQEALILLNCSSYRNILDLGTPGPHPWCVEAETS